MREPDGVTRTWHLDDRGLEVSLSPTNWKIWSVMGSVELSDDEARQLRDILVQELKG